MAPVYKLNILRCDSECTKHCHRLSSRCAYGGDESQLSGVTWRMTIRLAVATKTSEFAEVKASRPRLVLGSVTNREDRAL